MTQLIKNIKLGSDPEVFIVNKDGRFVPSFDLVGGTKHNPKPMGRKGFFVQEDNVALEYNIPPATSKEEFVEYIFAGLDLAKKMLPAGYDVRIQASTRFTPEQLKHPLADEFGCEPDKNAWTGNFNKKPEIPTDGLRATGGHVHLGYELIDPNCGLYMVDINQRLAQWQDVYLGVPFMLIDKDLDRRKLYGRAGAYRDKVYGGMEYRTLSSEWLQSKERTAWVYEQSMKSVARVNEGYQVDPADKIHILSAINKNNSRAIARIMDKYQIAI